MSNSQSSSSDSRNRMSVSFDIIESVSKGFLAEMIDMNNIAVEAKTTPWAIADSVECGDMWQTIVSRQDQREQHVTCLGWYLEGVAREETANQIQSYVRLLAQERDQVNGIVCKVLQAKYEPTIRIAMSRRHTKPPAI